jgi:glycine/D-amino acid oxidase-like deaminating enzyme
LADIKLSHAWSGVVAYTFHHNPHLGGYDGMHFAMGYCGSGVGRATYFGHKISLQLLGDERGKTAFDSLPLLRRSFYNGKPWFLPAILRWHALVDRCGG